MEKSSKVFVGMDVHKESIDVTLAEEGGEVRRLGQIGGDRVSLLKLVRKQQSKGGERVFVYEAGPCGFWIYRELAGLGERCMVVSPRWFLSWLATQRNVAAATQNQALSALLFLYKNVLGVELPWLGELVRARRPVRLPTVLSEDEVRRLLAWVPERAGLMVGLLYGSGLRQIECLSLRVKEIDFAYRQILVRDGKGAKDRVTMLPENLVQPLQRHLGKVRLLHGRDLKEGFGELRLPHALARKYPRAGRAWAWQYVFPSGSRSADPDGGVMRRHHVHPDTLSRAVARAALRAAQYA